MIIPVKEIKKIIRDPPNKKRSSSIYKTGVLRSADASMQSGSTHNLWCSKNVHGGKSGESS